MQVEPINPRLLLNLPNPLSSVPDDHRDLRVVEYVLLDVNVTGALVDEEDRFLAGW